MMMICISLEFPTDKQVHTHTRKQGGGLGTSLTNSKKKSWPKKFYLNEFKTKKTKNNQNSPNTLYKKRVRQFQTRK